MTKFSDLKLDPKVLKAVTEAGYESPTPIQQGAIPPALEGRDVLGIAQTGTGKTASFTLPMITMLGRGRARARMPRSLVLCPTRELAAQVAENFDTYAKHTRLTKALLIGGVSFGEQDKLIDRGVDVLIATPGRLLDHFERGKLLLTGVQIMVVDEADRMLDMGFIPDIERIFQLTPFTRQTLFFSATMAPEIERITNTFLHAPERIEIARQATTSETITQRLVELTPARRDTAAKQKRDLLRALIEAEGDKLKNAIIFCNRKTDVDIVAKSLGKYGYDAAPIHGDLEQSQRTRTLESFRDGKLRLLVASDVAARGLDIPAVSHVFNYDLPSHAEDYVHRIGRTGRAGRLGTAISISTPSDEKYLTGIEALVKNTLPRSDLPAGFAGAKPAQASQPEDAGPEDRKPASRQRSRRGKRDDSEQQSAANTAPNQPEAASQPAAPMPEAVKPEVAMPEAVDKPRKESQPRQDSRPAAAEPARREESRRDDSRRDENRRDNGNRGDTNRDNNRRDGRRGGNDGNRGQQIVGMGDHVPRFMTVELRISPMPEERPEEAPQAQPEAAQPEQKPKRTRSRRKSSAEKTAEKSVEAPVAEAPVVATSAETAAEAPARDVATDAAS
ncbi:DEAD/DEAH box helicase, partial [Paracoccus sediminilitoris]|uniref:DEAD/DEAH box helicase n=1 Tax=Paracoccus sediminilitoris TaxID=2202419 RepID=UPI001F184FB4